MPWSRIIVSGILWITLISCHRFENGEGDLVYWSSSNPEEMAFAQYYIELWNKDHIDSPITFQPVPEGQSSEEVILAAVVGKTTPDIYSNMWQGDVEDFALAGVLVRLDTLEGFMDFYTSDVIHKW